MKERLKQLWAAYNTPVTITWRTVTDDALIAGLVLSLSFAYNWDFWLLAIGVLVLGVLVADVVLLKKRQKR